MLSVELATLARTTNSDESEATASCGPSGISVGHLLLSGHSLCSTDLPLLAMGVDFWLPSLNLAGESIDSDTFFTLLPGMIEFGI